MFLLHVTESTPERAEAFLMSKLGSLDDDIHAMMGAAASIIPNILAHMKPGFEPRESIIKRHIIPTLKI